LYLLPFIITLASEEPMSQAVLHALERIFPSDRLVTDAARLAPYERDLTMPMAVRPAAIVFAQSRDEVIAAVRACYAARVPYVARGAGSSLCGGSLPVEGGIVIALKALNRVMRVDPVARLAVVEPGVVNLDVSRAAEPFNLAYAPDPSSQAFCTIGGNVAFNSGGAHCLKYGMTANHVLGLEAVLADGEVVRLGGESLENAGPDVTPLFVGSEGLFGIALEVTLRLVPRVESYRTVLATYSTMQAAGNAVAMVVASGLLPGALEIMDPLAIKATEAASHAGYPLDAAALVIVELEGETAQVDAELVRLLDVIRRSGAVQVRSAQSAEERAALWKGRKAAFTAVRSLSKRYIVQDGVVPRGKLGAALAEIERLSREYGIPVANVFHAGDGNLHPLILYEAEGVKASFEQAERLSGEILRMCIRMGGSITGEHGVGLEKRAYLPEMYGPAEMAAMAELRGVMDPATIANPGKMLFVDRAAEARAPRAARAARETLTAPVGAGGVQRPRDAAELAEVVAWARRVHVRGAGTKPALTPAPDPDAAVIETAALTGVREYEPGEFTFTALAGTPVAEVERMLAEHGQYLPFDPPFARAGATLGGAVASGLGGPGRVRFGGVRDFVIGGRFVDGRGRLLRVGAAVVKNAAGFDFPKLLVGSLGRLGVIAELTFKVFPSPEAWASLEAGHASLAAAIEAAGRLLSASVELAALEIEPLPQGALLRARLAGLAAQLPARLGRLAGPAGDSRTLAGAGEAAAWEASRDCLWAEDAALLVRVPATLGRVADIERAVAAFMPLRRYGCGGAAAWLAAPRAEHSLGPLHDALTRLGLRGLVVRGPAGLPLLGVDPDAPFRKRVLSVLDPDGRFAPYTGHSYSGG
jgi:glycolate oxidase